MTSPPPDLETRHALVFAIAHELGNHLAGIRLEAHLLDESLGAAGLARASLAIEGLAGETAPLLSLLRPLLAPGTSRGASRAPRVDALLAGVARQLEAEGLHGCPLEVEIAPDAAALAFPVEGAAALLAALVGPPASLAGQGGAIRFVATATDSDLALACALPGAAFKEAGAVVSGAAVTQGLRGRALAAAIARVLVGEVGGRVEVVSDAGASARQVVLRVPR